MKLTIPRAAPRAMAGLLSCLLFSCLLFSGGCAAVPRSPAVSARVADLTQERLRAHVEEIVSFGPRPAGDAAQSARTVEHIASLLRTWGYTVELERFVADTTVYERQAEPDGTVSLQTRTEPRQHVNVLAELPGRSADGPLLEIGAHYDTHAWTVGADDNTSAIAGLLEIARIARRAPVERTLRFCFFAMEELGLVGSTHHASQVAASERARHAGIIVLEMIGYATDEPDTQQSPVRIPLLLSPPREGNFIAVVGNFASGPLGNRVESAAARYAPELPVYSLNRIGSWFGDAARSDHKPYWNEGLRGVMLTDTANFRNPHYHKATDTPETLNYGFMLGVTKATASAALEWAGLRED